jgi:hypothetical protein
MLQEQLIQEQLRDLPPGTAIGVRYIDFPLRTTNRGAVLEVLERAAADDGFIAQLTYHGSEALEGYALTAEEQAALLSGDIRWIEAHVGKLTSRQKTWLYRRLEQEIW